jgi:hypothetical protein
MKWLLLQENATPKHSPGEQTPRGKCEYNNPDAKKKKIYYKCFKSFSIKIHYFLKSTEILRFNLTCKKEEGEEFTSFISLRNYPYKMMSSHTHVSSS